MCGSAHHTGLKPPTQCYFLHLMGTRGGAFVAWDVPLVNCQLGLRMGIRDGRPLASLVAPHPSLTQRRALHISHLMMQRGISEQSKAGFTPGTQPSVEVPWMVSLPPLPATQPSPTKLQEGSRHTWLDDFVMLSSGCEQRRCCVCLDP